MTDFIFTQILDLAIDRGDLSFLIGIWQGGDQSQREYIQSELPRLGRSLGIPGVTNFHKLVDAYYQSLVDQAGLTYDSEDYHEILSLVIENNSIPFAKFVLDQLTVIIDGGDLPTELAEDLSDEIEDKAVRVIREKKNDLFHLFYGYQVFINESIDAETDVSGYINVAKMTGNQEILDFFGSDDVR
ncbi:Hypothetical protein POVR1_LOCUS2 [uncultured virus]|nr:Hypothetical protein POVR1_LOCUS2 [uncultured virus]